MQLLTLHVEIEGYRLRLLSGFLYLRMIGDLTGGSLILKLLHKILRLEALNFVSKHDLIFCIEIWQRSSDKFEIENYQCITVPRPESLVIRAKGKRGHRGIRLFVSDTIYDGIEILDKIPQGLFMG